MGAAAPQPMKEPAGVVGRGWSNEMAPIVILPEPRALQETGGHGSGQTGLHSSSLWSCLVSAWTR